MKPFGYWLKHIDAQLEATMGQLLADEDVTRRQWQILNTIAARPSTMAEIDEAAKPFLTAETPTFRPMVDNLTARGWVRGEYELTDEGRQAYDRISAKVHAFRARTIDGLTNEEYVTLVTLLERVATNVDAAR
jgi:DNA-binding MarR family transcriptional regulator